MAAPLPSFHGPEPLSGFDDGLEVDPRDRSTSTTALVVLAVGLLVALLTATRAPALAGLALVAGIVGGGILDAPAGAERRRTAAALGVPAAGLLVLTAVFVSAL